MKILITGTSSGIGKGCAEFFLKKGHEVYGFDKNAATIVQPGYTHFCLDIRNKDSYPELPPVDILINNAGTQNGNDIDVNLKGPLHMAHAVIGHMIEQKCGVIINVGSIDGQTGGAAIDYSAAKSGVMNGLTKSLALYGAPHGVRCCCVSPGPVLTRPAMAKMRTPLGRAAETHEVVDLILYLCSDQAAFITGSNYLIDGGRSCGAQN